MFFPAWVSVVLQDVVSVRPLISVVVVVMIVESPPSHGYVLEMSRVSVAVSLVGTTGVRGGLCC